MWRGVNPGSKATSISLVLSAIVLVQVGSAIATTLFDELGPTGTVLLRLLLSSIVLLAIWRPSLAALRGEHRLELLAFAITLAGMNTCFYLAIDRIPLGIGVTLEFIGPLGVAFAASSLRADLLWASLAGAGILLLSPMPGGDLDLLGVAFAVLAGGFWAAYIVLSARVGRSLAGGPGPGAGDAGRDRVPDRAGDARGRRQAPPPRSARGRIRGRDARARRSPTRSRWRRYGGSRRGSSAF